MLVEKNKNAKKVGGAGELELAVQSLFYTPGASKTATLRVTALKLGQKRSIVETKTTGPTNPKPFRRVSCPSTFDFIWSFRSSLVLFSR